MLTSNSELKAVGRVVRTLRDSRKMSVNELASRSAISAATVEQIESGLHDITLLEVVALAKALGTNSEALLAGANL